MGKRRLDPRSAGEEGSSLTGQERDWRRCRESAKEGEGRGEFLAIPSGLRVFGHSLLLQCTSSAFAWPRYNKTEATGHSGAFTSYFVTGPRNALRCGTAPRTFFRFFEHIVSLVDKCLSLLPPSSPRSPSLLRQCNDVWKASAVFKLPAFHRSTFTSLSSSWFSFSSRARNPPFVFIGIYRYFRRVSLAVRIMVKRSFQPYLFRAPKNKKKKKIKKGLELFHSRSSIPSSLLLPPLNNLRHDRRCCIFERNDVDDCDKKKKKKEKEAVIRPWERRKKIKV